MAEIINIIVITIAIFSAFSGTIMLLFLKKTRPRDPRMARMGE